MKNTSSSVPQSAKHLSDLQTLHQFMPLVEKPARYVGQEIGSVTKDLGNAKLRIALAFPDAYEVGMSHLGLKILYWIINSRPDLYAERVFAPWPDMEGLMRRESAPLTTLETCTPLSQMDIVGFSLQYELCATGVLQMLELGRIPLRARDRGEADPFVVGGGPAAFNPAPLSAFFDAFVIGDGEEAILDLTDTMLRWKAERGHRSDLLKAWKALPGVYVPALHEPGEIVSKRIVADLDCAAFPSRLVVPFCETVHDRVGIEISRGCTRGCRFCQAGMLYRPVRERRPEKIQDLARQNIAATGWEEVALLSLSSGDYSRIGDLICGMTEEFASKKVALSLPSLRTDTFDAQMADEIRRVRKTGFTLAPEAGTDRLRRVINKGNCDEDLQSAVISAFKAGWQSVKLYFMLGLPSETDEDLDGIANLILKASKWARGGRITVSFSTFVPKSHTPFQWAGQISMDETTRRQHYVRRYLHNRKVKIKFHDPRISFLEGVFARGDEALADVVELAFQKGARFDGWDDRLDMDLWIAAFQDAGIDPNRYLGPRDLAARLPWDCIDSGVSKDYLIAEWNKALSQDTTGDCRHGDCAGCGVCNFADIYPRLVQGDGSDRGIHEPAVPREISSSAHPQDAADVPVSKEANPGDQCADKGGSSVCCPRTMEETDRSRTNAGQRAAPPEPVPEGGTVRRFRMRYEKKGAMRFLGHQDLIRLFHRAFRRTGLVLDYSKGFHPHPKMRFSPPLGLGIESVAEYLDFDLVKTDLSAPEVQHALQRGLPTGIKSCDVWETSLIAPPISGKIRQFIYEVTSLDSLSSAEIIQRVRKFESSPVWEMTSVRKGKSRTRDLKNWVESVEYSDSVMKMILKSDQSGSVHPIEAASAILGLSKDTIRSARVVKTRVEFDETLCCDGKGLSDG